MPGLYFVLAAMLGPLAYPTATFQPKTALTRPYMIWLFPRERFLDPPPPPPINFVHESYIYHMDIIGHVAVALDPRSLAKVIGPLAAV